MMTKRSRLIAGLLVIAAILLPIGVALERSGEGSESHEEASIEGREGASRDVDATEPEQEGESGEESLLGVETESWPLVALAVAASLGLAAGILARPSIVLSGAVLLFVLLFAAFDLLEISRQLSESRTGVAGVASMLLGLHLAAAVLAAKMLVAARRGAAQPG